MSKAEFIKLSYAILGACKETEGHTIPASSLYLMLDMNMQKFEAVRTVFTDMKWATFTSETMTVTENGIRVYDSIHDALQKTNKTL